MSNPTIEAMEPEDKPIICYKCGSTNWACWDEQTEWFEDTTETDADEAYFECPVGYLKCTDCGTSYIHTGFDDDPTVKHLGSYEEAFGSDDDWSDY